jgi:SAM domain (Sterile alpha motif)
MQQIADWLEKLGMSEYAHRFAENGIDISVLRHLTDQDLKDIGGTARASAVNAGGDCQPRPFDRYPFHSNRPA